MKKIFRKAKVQLFKVVGEEDEKTCPDCAEWQGKIVAGTEDGIHPTIEDFMNSKAFHPNCRCALRPIIEEDNTLSIEDKKMKKEAEKKKKKTLEEMAMNTANFEDEIVYRGFVQTGIEEDDYEFDDRWVMIAPIGEYDGTTTTGEVVKEIFNVEDYEQIVFKFHEDGQELPLDRDHASMKQPLERDTQAYGWIYDLRLMSGGADDYNGLYAKFRWTDEGRNLVLSRAYRFLSPVFTLSEDGHPTSLVNVALTNRPNFDLPPIFNTDVSQSETPISEEHTMNIEELKNAIIEGVVERLQTINTKPEKETPCEEPSKEEEKETTVEVSKTEETETTEEKKTPCESSASTDETKEEPETDEAKEEEKEEKEEKKELSDETDKPAETDDEKEEVITEEVMNTVPTSITPSINKI